ncbi:HAD-IA family hydrolase [Streptomyces sp. 7-21]|uniref:HAD family hydrolase n=1 Tax=Streptomyces sp. 7-21 TaxID=2802283 RepID=UPI0027DD313F|nr:HAD-IA family hydrolase [Streptomyces sp. 7-21]
MRTGPAKLWACRAVVFDTDGVIIDSAGLHATAWKAAFDACPGVDPPFDQDADYRTHVDGKSRHDGAAAFLAARGIDDPATVSATAARKEEEFVRLLHEQGIEALSGAVRLLCALHDARVRCAAVSASRHARDLLACAGVRSLLQTVVDGNDAARLRLPGKPEPALFTEAARRLGAEPPETAVVEDALAGVAAGRRGGFALVVGVNRDPANPAAAEGLRAHGADVVVADAGELLTEATP